jgi:hypothetical protein
MRARPPNSRTRPARAWCEYESSAGVCAEVSARRGAASENGHRYEAVYPLTREVRRRCCFGRSSMQRRRFARDTVWPPRRLVLRVTGSELADAGQSLLDLNGPNPVVTPAWLFYRSGDEDDLPGDVTGLELVEWVGALDRHDEVARCYRFGEFGQGRCARRGRAAVALDVVLLDRGEVDDRVDPVGRDAELERQLDVAAADEVDERGDRRPRCGSRGCRYGRSPRRRRLRHARPRRPPRPAGEVRTLAAGKGRGEDLADQARSDLRLADVDAGGADRHEPLTGPGLPTRHVAHVEDLDATVIVESDCLGYRPVTFRRWVGLL